MEELYDDIDDGISFSNEDEIIAQQCLAIYKSEQGKDKYVGTGVIISNEGLFVSVGHNFKENCIYKASYKSILYNIDVIYNEYSKEQCLDFFIGKLLDFNCSNSLVGFAPTDKLQIGANLRVCGYKATLIGDTPIHQGIIITPQLKVNQYCIDTHILSKEEWLSHQVDMLTPRKDCNIFKYIDVNTERYMGLSGGPVYSTEGIHGILIADLFLPSEYILEHLSKKL